MKIKTVLIYSLKFAIAGGLIYYMISSGQLNIAAVYEAKNNYLLITLAFVMIFASALINFYRWDLLLKGQDIHLKAKDVISLCFIGLFFTTMLPGAVGGDIVKSVYITRKTHGRKTAAVTTILLDRLIGAVALIVIATVGLLLHYKVFSQQPALRTLGITIVLVLVGIVAFTLLMLSRRVNRNRKWQALLKNLPLSTIIIKVYEAFHAYRNKHKYLTWALLVSFVTHGLNILAFYTITRALNFDSLNIYAYLFIVPVGLITTAIPLAPAGIGIGQAAFLKLFEWTLGIKTTVGADAITIMQGLSIIIFMIGGIFYLTYKKDIEP
ncbi:MAG: lysylphosphatidylglycerol synthase transmembrane domain-containing protein [Pseudomonadota bacterium]